MANIYQDGVRIQVLISEDTEIGRFQDSLYFSKAEFDELSDGALLAQKKDRKDKWVKAVKDASKKEYNPTEEELLAYKAELEAQLAEVNSKLG